jgi:prephenate dehydratase
MHMPRKIGYQGDIYSQSYLAAKRLCDSMGWVDGECHFMPCRNPSRLVHMLLNREIDYGVLATQNEHSGIFQESYEAIRSSALTFIASDVY